MICTFQQRFTTDGQKKFGQHVSAARNCSPVLAVERKGDDLVDELA